MLAMLKMLKNSDRNWRGANNASFFLIPINVAGEPVLIKDASTLLAAIPSGGLHTANSTSHS
jgi:hypothetical protein